MEQTFYFTFLKSQILLDKTDDVELSEEWLTFEECCARELRDAARIRAIPDLQRQEHLQPASEEDTAHPNQGMRPTGTQGSGPAARTRNSSGEVLQQHDNLDSLHRLTSDLPDQPSTDQFLPLTDLKIGTGLQEPGSPSFHPPSDDDHYASDDDDQHDSSQSDFSSDILSSMTPHELR